MKNTTSILTEAKLHSSLRFQGLEISIEVPAGGFRTGEDKAGKAWKHKIGANYGYIKKTHSPDGEHLDCYVRRNPNSRAKVYVVHQMTVDGSRFDEDKVMLGFSNAREARNMFRSCTFKPGTMYGGMTEFDPEHFKLAAFSASRSKAMLSDEETYAEFRKKGKMPKGVISPLEVARRVSEDINLSEALAEMSRDMLSDPFDDAMALAGFSSGEIPDDMSDFIQDAWNNYSEGYQGEMDYDEFVAKATDAIQAEQNRQSPTVLPIRGVDRHLMNDVNDPLHGEIEEDEYVGRRKRRRHHGADDDVHECFAVVVNTQMLVNQGSPSFPMWATSGGRSIKVRSGIPSLVEAHQVAHEIGAGSIKVELEEKECVLGIEVMEDGYYRQFHEEADVVEDVWNEEENTDDVFFMQQIMEIKKLAGLNEFQASNDNKWVPSERDGDEVDVRVMELMQAGNIVYYDAIKQAWAEQKAKAESQADLDEGNYSPEWHAKRKALAQSMMRQGKSQGQAWSLAAVQLKKKSGGYNE